MNRWLHQLQHRGVIRAAIGYAATAWLLLQVSDAFLPALNAPDWVMPLLIVLAAVGFIPALLFSWFFEITPECIEKSEDVPIEHEPRPIFDRQIDFVIIGILAGGLTLSVYVNMQSGEPPPESVSILIADFKNETGNALFSGVLEETLRIGLEVAPFVEIYSRDDAISIAGSLQSANDDNEQLDVETAGIVALRQGIDIVIQGRIERGDDGLTISVNGVAPAEQRDLFAATESAISDTAVLGAIANLSTQVRGALGDTETTEGAGDSETFAVSNLEAAAAYLVAQDLQRKQRYGEATEHYRRALQHDPDFTRAYAGLALAEQYLGLANEAAEHWAAALARLDRLTERGRLRTLGSYYATNQRDYDRAVDTYERLIDRFPVDNIAYNNLAVSSFLALDFERALEVGREVASRFPNHSGYAANSALYSMYAGRFDEALEIAERVMDTDKLNAFAHVVAALASATSGDVAAARDTYERMTQVGQVGRSIASEGLADLAIYQGDIGTALAILDAAIENEVAASAYHTAALKQVMKADALLRREMHDDAQMALNFALEYAGGDPAILVPAAMMLADLGDAERALAIAGAMSNSLSKVQRAYADAVRANVAYAQGDIEVAVSSASSGLESADLWLLRFLRGRIHLAAGQTEEALSDLRACEERIGEGIAVFLNDRPSLRYIRDLKTALESIDTPPRQAALAH